MITVRRLIWLQVVGATIVLIAARGGTRFGPEMFWGVTLFPIYISIPIIPLVVIGLLLFRETELSPLHSVSAMFATLLLAATTFLCFIPLCS